MKNSIDCALYPKHKFIGIYIVLLCFVILQSCSDKLTRNQAEKEIVKKMELPSMETLKLQKKYLTDHQPVQGFGMVCLKIGDFNFSEYENILNSLQKRKYINLKIDEYYNDCNDLYTNVELTEMGEEQLINETDGFFEIKLCDVAFGEITGIIEYTELQVADVNYTLKRENYTEFGLIMINNKKKDETIKRLANFSKYDDGWRMH